MHGTRDRLQHGCAGFSDAGASGPVPPQIGSRSPRPGLVDRDVRMRAAQTRCLAVRRARLRGLLEGLSAPGCAFTFANNKLNSWRDMPMGVLKRLAFPDSLVYGSM